MMTNHQTSKVPGLSRKQWTQSSHRNLIRAPPISKITIAFRMPKYTYSQPKTWKQPPSLMKMQLLKRKQARTRRESLRVSRRSKPSSSSNKRRTTRIEKETSKSQTQMRLTKERNCNKLKSRFLTEKISITQAVRQKRLESKTSNLDSTPKICTDVNPNTLTRTVSRSQTQEPHLNNNPNLKMMNSSKHTLMTECNTYTS